MLSFFLVFLLRSFNFNFCFTAKRGFTTETRSALSVRLSEPFVNAFIPDDDFLFAEGEDPIGFVKTST